MPELPEVETIARQLQTALPFAVESVRISEYEPRLVKERWFSPVGQELVAIGRTGKMLVFSFANGGRLLTCLGMSGSWQIGALPMEKKHTHLSLLGCGNGQTQVLNYVDPRRFGRIYLCDEAGAARLLSRLGPDVSTDQFTVEHVVNVFNRHSTRPVKALLLEQRYFAGVGNYMASEILAHAGILPARPAGDLSQVECRALVRGVKKTLDRSLKRRGLTFHGGYVDALGQPGAALNQLVVFHQEVCGLCETHRVVRQMIAGRATYYCPACQR